MSGLASSDSNCSPMRVMYQGELAGDDYSDAGDTSDRDDNSDRDDASKCIAQIINTACIC